MSQQLGALDRRLTKGQRRRRFARIARRRGRGILHVAQNAPAKRPHARVTWKAFRARVKSARAKAAEFLVAIVARRDQLTGRTTPRCPFVNVRRDVSGNVIARDRNRYEELGACGGRMRPLPMPRDVTTQDWECGSCGRVWHQTNEVTRGFGGWVEVYGR